MRRKNVSPFLFDWLRRPGFLMRTSLRVLKHSESAPKDFRWWRMVLPSLSCAMAFAPRSMSSWKIVFVMVVPASIKSTLVFSVFWLWEAARSNVQPLESRRSSSNDGNWKNGPLMCFDFRISWMIVCLWGSICGCDIPGSSRLESGFFMYFGHESSPTYVANGSAPWLSSIVMIRVSSKFSSTFERDSGLW